MVNGVAAVQQEFSAVVTDKMLRSIVMRLGDRRKRWRRAAWKSPARASRAEPVTVRLRKDGDPEAGAMLPRLRTVNNNWKSPGETAPARSPVDLCSVIELDRADVYFDRVIARRAWQQVRRNNHPSIGPAMRALILVKAVR
jgi:hypothetical protein